MKFDLTREHASRAYPLLSGLVSPRPIALITTVNEEGKVNAAPFSFFSPIGTSPVMLVFAPGNKTDGLPKDTYKNLRKTGECVVHIIDEPMAEAMNLCATALPQEISEVEQFGLNTLPGDTVSVPRLAEAPVAMECEYFSTMECGKNNRAVFVTIRALHVKDELIDPATLRVVADLWNPVGAKCSPQYYCRTSDTFILERPE